MLSSDKRMLPFQHIAVLTDLGDDLDKTLDYTAALCRWYGADMMLFHVTNEKSMDESREQLSAVVEERDWCDIRAKVIVSKANMSDALSELDTYSPDILVLTTRAKTNVRKWVAGSATQEIFRQTHRPVLVLGPHITHRDDPTPRPFHRILYTTDMSAVSVMALHFAAGMANDTEALLTALYVEPDREKGFTADRVMTEQRLRDWLREHIGGMAHAIEHAQINVAFGSPTEHILAAAADQKPDLIVMGAHGTGALAGLAGRFLGGTVYETCCKANCPLLIVPEAR